MTHADPPAWWTEVGTDGHAAINDEAPEGNPLAVANIGQAKFMAKRALEALRAVSSGTADIVEAELVGPGKIIPSWTPPTPGTPLSKAQLSPLLVGQLKAIAHPFYTALHDMDSEWLYSEMTENGTADLANLDHYFPWTQGSQDDKDKAIASIGQLKAVFSLRFENLQQTLTEDDEGVPDEEVVTEITNDGTQPEYIPAPGAPPPSTYAAASTSRPYVIQFKKAKKTLRKHGLKPLHPGSENDNRRYLKFIRRYFVTNYYRYRLQSPIWRVGHRIANGYAINDFTQDSEDSLTVDPRTGVATQSGFLKTYWWENGHFDPSETGAHGPAPYTPSDNQYSWWFLTNNWFPDTFWEYEVPPYVHSSNHQFDGPAYMNFEQMMMDENTLENVIYNSFAYPPAYPSKWTNGNPTAEWKVRKDGLGVTYGKVKFRFKSTSSAKVPVTAKVVFKPRGGGPKEVVKTVSWNRGTVSKEVVIDPQKLKFRVEGTFHIELGTMNFQPDVDQENLPPGRRIIIVADQKDVGGGSPAEIASPELEFPGMDDSWFDGSNITLTKESGTGSVRFSTVNGTIPMGSSSNLAATYFHSGGSGYNKDWNINGIDPGPLTLKARYKKGGLTLFVVKNLTVIAGDLDIDSDNTGIIESTVAEENTENDLKNKPGKIILVQPDSQNDSDGIPDSINGMTEIKVRASGFASSDKIKFIYTGSDPAGTTSSTSGAVTSYQNGLGLLRLWKKQNGGLPTSQSAYIQPGRTYTLAELGITSDAPVSFFVQGVSPVLAKTSIKCEMSKDGVVVEDTVGLTLIPSQAVSRDKFLAGSFEIPAGWDNLEMEFAGPNENLGKYGGFLGGGTTRIHNKVEDIMNPADTPLQPAGQKVWFVRDSTNSRRIHYYTCFNSVGNVQIKLYLNNATTPIGTIHHLLTAAPDFASTIAYVDAWVKGSAFNWPGAENPPGVLATPPAGGQAASMLDGEIDNLTRACLIPFFNVINQVEGLAAVATGLFDGVKSGLQDDWMTVMLIKQGLMFGGNWAWQQAETELQEWRTNPVKRATELKQLADRICQEFVFAPLQQIQQDLSTWEGFQKRAWRTWDSIKGGTQQAWTVTKNVWASLVDGLTGWADDFCGRMMLGAEKTHWQNAPWAKDPLLADINSATRQVSYNFGYIFGYLSEQVAITALTAGSSKLAQVAAKGGAALSGSLAKRTLAAVASRAHLLKRLLAEAVQLPAEFAPAFQRGFSAASTGPTGVGIPLSAMEIMQEGANAGKLVWREYVDNLVGKTNIRQLVKQGGEGIIERQFARLITILGDEFTAEIGRNFLKVADDFILVKKADGTVDEFFEGFFKSMEGNPSLMKHADDMSVKVGGSLEPLSPNAKARLKQILSDPDPGNPWKLDTPEEWNPDNIPVPSNFYARGLLLELQQFKKIYKPAGFLHHPTAAGYDYYSTALDRYVQMKTLKNPDGAASAMKKAIDGLIGATPAGSTLQLHIVKRPGTTSEALKQAIADHIETKPQLIQERFLQTIITEFSYP
ncbi:hypothetical protein GCM10023212_15900 [Luteolibacter yonseiensis]